MAAKSAKKGTGRFPSKNTGRYGQTISSKTTRQPGVTLVNQTYGLSPKTTAKMPKRESEKLTYKTEIPLRIALINDAIKICRERGDNDAAFELNEARLALEKALHARKPENRKAWYESAKRSVSYAKQKSRAIANKRFFGSANGNRI